MSSVELSEWMAYDSMEPIGDIRADLRAGVVASTIANSNRDPKKQREPFSATDFLLFRTELGEDAPSVNEPKAPELLAAKFDALIGQGE